MDRSKIVAMMAAASVLSFASAKHTYAASLGLSLTSYVSDSSTPAPGVSGLYIYKNVDKLEGEITSIGGFSSLEGVAPSQLTISGGDSVLLSLVNRDGILYTTSGSDDAHTSYFNILLDGEVIASALNTQRSGTLNAIAGSPNYGEATSTTSLTFSGVVGHPFYQEILELTNGTGNLVLELGTLIGIKSSSTIGTVGDTNVFTYTGNTLAISPSVAAVPEPSTMLGLAVLGLAIGIRCSKSKQQSNSNLS